MITQEMLTGTRRSKLTYTKKDGWQVTKIPSPVVQPIDLEKYFPSLRGCSIWETMRKLETGDLTDVELHLLWIMTHGGEVMQEDSDEELESFITSMMDEVNDQTEED
jgi:hypothetical protein